MSKQKFSYLAFSLYLALLVWLVIFKLSTSLSDLPQMRQLNLIPFAEPVIVNGRVVISEIIANGVVFIPLGWYAVMLCRQFRFLPRLFLGIILSLLFETVQYIFAIGGSDITDVLMNTLGTFLGIVTYMGLEKIFPNKAKPMVNGLVFSVCLAFLCLGALLFLANQ